MNMSATSYTNLAIQMTSKIVMALGKNPKVGGLAMALQSTSGQLVRWTKEVLPFIQISSLLQVAFSNSFLLFTF